MTVLLILGKVGKNEDSDGHSELKETLYVWCPRKACSCRYWGHFNPVHILPFCFFEIHLNIVLPTVRPSKLCSLSGFTEHRERFWIYPRSGSRPVWLGIFFILLSLSSHILECCFLKVDLNTFGCFWNLFLTRGSATYTVEKRTLNIRKLSKCTNSRH